ncbi:hypothetical protein [Streptomyces sp. NPDC057250]|uniref:hypothetical protein n=1 Tax=Streptomyces sp. NPDC057250 TaxID=3346068 RepID=UPI00363FFA0B
MTRAAALALRAAGGLRENCVVVITDGPTIGTAGNTSPTEIELNPTGPSEFGLTARVHTTFDDSAWSGLYDVDLGAAGSIIQLTDEHGNTVKDVDADAPTVHTQFPWHLGSNTLRDNTVEDAVLTGWDALTRPVTNSRIENSTVNATGWTTGAITGAQIDTSSTITTGPGLTVTNSEIHQSTVTNSGTGTITVTTSSSLYQTTLVNDPGSVKNITVTDSDVRGSLLRTQAGTVVKTLSVGASRLRGKPLGDSVTHLGDVGLSITNADVYFNSTWNIDGPNGPNVSVRDCTIDGIGIQRSATAGRCDITNGYFTGTLFDHQGSGQILATTGVQTKGGVLRLTAPSTGDLTFQRSTLEDATVQVTGARSLSVLFGSYVGGQSTVTESGTTPTATAAIGDRLDQSRVEGVAQVTFSTTTGSLTNTMTRSTVRGSSVVGEGVVTVTGTTDGAFIDNCQILGGIVTINNASSGLSGPSAFTDNHIRGGSTLTYTGGDATAKQIRNNTVEGLSTVTLTGLTGSAGAGLADVFGMSVRGQSTLTVTGARVVGQPVRDCTVEQGSVLNIPASGCTQRCRVAGGATVNAGAFVHFDTEVSLATTKTLTAANLNRLCNKAFDDCL